jgi:hypothetical protein
MYNEKHGPIVSNLIRADGGNGGTGGNGAGIGIGGGGGQGGGGGMVMLYKLTNNTSNVYVVPNNSQTVPETLLSPLSSSGLSSPTQGRKGGIGGKTRGDL